MSDINNKPFGYIYIMINKLNGKIYIGKREKSKFDPSYWGSGVRLKNAVKKYHNIKVVCIETGEIYESIKEANIKNNLKSIGACISGRTQTAGTLHWEVYDENKIYQTSQI